MNAATRILALVLALASGGAAAADVGRVVLAAGDTTALRQGQVVKLALGTPVQDQDVLRTGASSNLQVRFVDDSYVALREASELRVDQFRFNEGKGGESAAFSLLKGGLRAVTGLIGRQNHDDYKMVTPTATIGIRGTDYAATYCQGDCRNADGSPARDGLYGRVIGQSQGTNQIEVSNDANRRTLGINSNFFVGDRRGGIELLLVAPEFVLSKLEGRGRGGQGAAGGSGSERSTSGGASEESRPSTIPPPLPQLQFVATQNLGPQGTPSALGEQQQSSNAQTGQLAYAYPYPSFSAGGVFSLPTSSTTYSGVNPVSFNAGSSFGSLAGGSIVETGSIGLADGGTMNWGRWSGATSITDPIIGAYTPVTGVPFVVGNANTVIPTGGTFLYSLAGGPNVRDASNGIGNFTGGAFNVSFGSTSGSLSVASPLTILMTSGPNSGANISLGSCTSGCTFTNSSPVAGNMVLSGICTNGLCSTMANVAANAAGFFVGPQGAGLAVAGNINSTSGPSIPTTTFAAGFKR